VCDSIEMRKLLILSLVLCLCCVRSAQAQPDNDASKPPEPGADAPLEITSEPVQPAAPPAAAAPARAAGEVQVGEPGSANAPASSAPTSAELAPAALPSAEAPASPAAASTLPTPPPAAAEVTEDPRSGILARAGYPLTPSVTSANYADELVVSGYVQAQYESRQDSEDAQLQGGALINRDRFVLRRGRVRVTRDWEWGQVLVEADGNTVRGPSMRLQKAEVSLLYGRQPDPDRPPLVQLTFGQFDAPFGFEIPYTSRARWFTERSAGSRAIFPAEPDVGVRLSGGWAFLRYAIAITNGEPLEEASGFALRDPNRNKDITGRLGAEAKVTRNLVIAGGVSFNRGRGYHAATDDTKSTLTWRDANENGAVDSGEVLGQPGSQGTAARTFERWAMGADIEVLLRTKLGWSMLQAEAFAASNLDRGLFIADPIVSGADVREYSYMASLTQEITPYATLGFRYDYYNPNSDFLDHRAGRQLPVSQRIRSFTPFVGLAMPGQARLVFEYVVSNDYLARDSRGVPTDYPNNQWTLRLQGSF